VIENHGQIISKQEPTRLRTEYSPLLEPGFANAKLSHFNLHVVRWLAANARLKNKRKYQNFANQENIAQKLGKFRRGLYLRPDPVDCV
jgi:hypothetical protein